MNLEIAILKELEAAHPRQLKRRVLDAELSLSAQGATKTAIDRAVRVLESKGQLRVFAGEDVTRVVITDDGLNRIADLG